jgi:hypothetical protein
MRCDGDEYAAPGLRVAPTADGTWLVSATTGDSVVYRVNADKQDRLTLPNDFDRTTMFVATAADGTLHIAADTTHPDGSGSKVTYPGGVTHVALVNGAFKSEVVFDNPEKYTSVIDFDIGPKATPTMWILSDAPDQISKAAQNSNGAWDVAVIPKGDYTRFVLANDGSVVPVAYRKDGNANYDVYGNVGGMDVKLAGTQLDYSFPTVTYTAPLAVPAADGPLFALALGEDVGISVVPVKAGAAPQVQTKIKGTDQPYPTCMTPGDLKTCKGTCHETAVGGGGVEPNAFAIGMTDDGRSWLAYVETRVDQVIAYSPQGDPGAETCIGNVQSDASKGVLHLVSVTADGAAKEVLSMPVDRPGGADSFGDFSADAHFIDARAFGKDIAIGLRTGWITDKKAVRVIRIDTSKL